MLTLIIVPLSHGKYSVSDHEGDDEGEGGTPHPRGLRVKPGLGP